MPTETVATELSTAFVGLVALERSPCTDAHRLSSAFAFFPRPLDYLLTFCPGHTEAHAPTSATCGSALINYLRLACPQRSLAC